MTKPHITVICPVHNEQETIPLFYDRFKNVIRPLESDYIFELMFTNNASTDNTLSIIQNLAATDPMVNVITLSRNFGYQKSLTAGLSYAKGDAIVIIDVDCEDPPELIPQFIESWRNEGCDIVYGQRDQRPEPRIILMYRKLFYRLLTRISDSPTILDMAEFSLFTTKVRDLILKNKTTTPFIRNEIAYVGFKRKGIRYNRQKRIAGKTHYNLFRMLVFAVAGILTASTYPLRVALYSLFPAFLVNTAAIITYLFIPSQKIINLLICADLMYLMFTSAFIAVYLARVYNDLIGRPVYIIDWDRSILRNTEA
jgi:polyisoprenyl-phosphate glycosyltransferase